MDIPVNVAVNCVDGPGGRSTFVILNPKTAQVSAIVVEVRVFPRTERVVPVDLIRESTPQRIELRCTQEELASLPPFVEQEYQRGKDEREHYEPGQWLFAPAANPVPSAVPLEHTNMAANHMALQRGAKVQASDGPVGSVADLVVDPVNSRLRLLIVRQGGVVNQRQVTIAAEQIDRIEDNTIYLKIDRHAVDLLPDVPAQG